MMAWVEKLAALGSLSEQEPMARHVTLAVGGAARWFFCPQSVDALRAALALVPASVPLLPLGRGSNLLVVDHGFDGLVIDLGALDGLAVYGMHLHCGAGVRMSSVAARCADAGFTGLEFMATVPGDIGGAVAMNAGAFGQQVSDCLLSISVVLRDGCCQRLTVDQLGMGYRSSSLPRGALVVKASFVLQAADQDAVRRRIRQMRDQRGRSQPLSQPNCGSVFKNPPGDHAARLIEAVGLKGHRVGGAEISSQHANFIVNYGGASSSDVLALMDLAQREVARAFDVALQPELKVVGR